MFTMENVPTIFDLFVTTLESEGPLLKVWGQTDHKAILTIEAYLLKLSPEFDKGNYVPNIATLQVGQICFGKYNDDIYYRTKILNLNHVRDGVIIVHFVDYGNVESLPLTSIRIIDNIQSTPMGCIPPLANEYILAGSLHYAQNWDEKSVECVSQMVCNLELKAVIVALVSHYKLIRMELKGKDLSAHLIQMGIALPITVNAQELMLNQTLHLKNKLLTQHILQGPLPVSSNSSPQVNLRSEARMMSFKQSNFQRSESLGNRIEYKSTMLPVFSEHKVTVSAVEDGPKLFSIQLQSWEKNLSKIMTDVNSIPLIPLTEFPGPGTLCIAHCKGHNYLCRAVITQIVDLNVKVYFVDFGHSDIVDHRSVFCIPPELVTQKIIALRFSLAGLKSINLTTELKQFFKEYVKEKIFNLKVCAAEGPPLVQYGELYDKNGQNVLDILKQMQNPRVIKYRTMKPLETDCIADVLISYVKSCQEFYVHLLFNADSLTRLMIDLAAHCERAEVLALNKIKVGTVCCAYYFDDDQWYRAEVIGTDGKNFRVKYVDYGNEASVAPSALKEITPDLVSRLDIQAILCCLNGFQNTPVDDAQTIEFESLALENKYTMKILEYHTNDVLLVDLTDLSHISVTEILNAKKNVEKPTPAPIISQVENLNIEQVKQRDKRSPRNRNNEKSRSFKESSDDNQSGSQSSDHSKKSSVHNTSEENKFYKKEYQDNRRKFPQDNQHKFTQNANQFDRNRGDVKNYKKQRNTSTEKNFNIEDQKITDFKEDFRKPRTSKFDRKQPNNKKWRGGLNESWSSDKSSDKSDYTGKSNRTESFRNNRKEKQKKHVISQPVNYAHLNDPYPQLEITEGMIETVNISWFYNPTYFYCQVKSSEDTFRKMMSTLQRLYLGRPPISESVPVGSSVIATFAEDSQLYRATVLEIRYPKYKVFYVDFGNSSFVDKKNVWNVEQQFMTLPVQAIKCTLLGIHPTGSVWNDSDEMDDCFNKENYQCVFHGCVDDKHVVELSLNGQFVTDNLISKGLAVRESVDIVEDPENNMMQQIPGIKNNLDDAPVDLDLLIGQQMIVHISFIFNLERFFIQLDKTKAEAVLNAVTSYAKSENSVNLEKLDPEQLIVGTVCLVQLDGGLFQRGIVMDTNSTNGIYVEFIDVGGGDEISNDKMFLLPFDLSNYYYQALECTVDNFKSDANTNLIDDDFKNRFENKSVIIVVNGIDNGRLFVTLYNLDGTYLDLLPKNLNIENINPLCPMPVTNAQLRVCVSSVNALNSIFIQRSQDLDAISLLLDNMYSHYESQESLEQFDIVIDETYAVKSKLDDNWYRGRAVNETSEGVQILYIDYGNDEIVDKSSIRKLDPVFFSIPEFSLQISLPIMSTNDQIKNKIEELTIEKEFLSKLAFTDGWWYAELYENGIALSQILIESGDATILDFDPFKRRHMTSRKSKIELLITHVDTPNEFYAQFTDDDLSVKMLQEELMNEIESLQLLEAPDAGVLCAAKYSADGIWYRAEVLDADEHITTVRFIDFGNTDVLDNNSNVIKTLPSRMLTIERYAKKCSLDITPVSREEWNQNVCEIFEQKVIDQILPAEILYQDDKGIFYVNLFIQDSSLSEMLIEEGHGATIIRNIEEEISTKTGFVSHIESVEEFWIQLESSCPDLEMMTDLLADAQNFPDLTDHRPGVLCAAKFPEDEMWYRGRILTVKDTDIEVLFIDYGNSSVSTELKILPEEVLNIRSLAMKCALQKPDDIDDWENMANDNFREISADGATVFNVKVLTTGETSTVELTINGENIVNKISSRPIAQSSPVNEVNIHKIVICRLESPESFWIQFVSQEDVMRDLSKRFSEIEDSFLETVTLETDDIFGAYSPKHKCWARAKVIEHLKDDYSVLLIDFGDIVSVQKLKILPPNIINIPPLAKHCSLVLPSGVQTWPDFTGKRFEEISSSCNHFFEAELINDHDSFTSIKLFLNGKNILDQMFETSEPTETQSASEEISDISLTKICDENTDLLNKITNIEHPTSSENENNNDSLELVNNKNTDAENIEDSLNNTTNEEYYSENENKNDSLEVPNENSDAENMKYSLNNTSKEHYNENENKNDNLELSNENLASGKLSNKELSPLIIEKNCMKIKNNASVEESNEALLSSNEDTVQSKESDYPIITEEDSVQIKDDVSAEERNETLISNSEGTVQSKASADPIITEKDSMQIKDDISVRESNKDLISNSENTVQSKESDSNEIAETKDNDSSAIVSKELIENILDGITSVSNEANNL